MREFEQAVHHVTAAGEDVAHVMEERGTQVITDQRKRQRWSTYFKIVDEKSIATQRKSGGKISRARLVDAKSAV